MAKVVISIRKMIVVAIIFFILYRFLVDPTPFTFGNNDNTITNIVENFMTDEKKEDTKTESEDGEQGVVQVTSQKGSVVQIPELEEVKTEEVVTDNKCGGFVSSELLPTEDKTDDFAEFSPVHVDNNFLDASRFLSMQTSLLRNTNLQIRPEPEVPREKVCPWNQSTIYRENTEPRNKGFHGVDENF